MQNGTPELPSVTWLSAKQMSTQTEQGSYLCILLQMATLQGKHYFFNRHKCNQSAARSAVLEFVLTKSTSQYAGCT
jgi:hypothetical protein